jgi:hypothetical protein
VEQEIVVGRIMLFKTLAQRMGFMTAGLKILRVRII